MNIARIIASVPPAERDATTYIDDEGLVCCRICGKRKEGRYDFGNGLVTVRQMCDCEAAEQKKIEEEEKHQRFLERCEANRRIGIADRSYLEHRFSDDDGRNAKKSDVCQKYAEHFSEMKSNNIGILLYGSFGTGKTFLSACIANELLDKGETVLVTNFSSILNRLQGFEEDKQDFIDGLCRFDLLIIDDLGVERNTPYALEQVYNVIDARYRSGKPIIVTTNLSIEEIKNPPSPEYGRIYDRVVEMCPIKMSISGESQRATNAAEKRKKAIEILGI